MPHRKSSRVSFFGGSLLGILIGAACRPPEVVPATAEIPARVTAVVDGETLHVTAEIDVDVCLEGCDVSAESHREAVEELERHARGREGLLLFSTSGRGGAMRLGSLFTSRRVAANIRLDGDEETLSERMIRLGHAEPINPPRASR